MVDRSKNRNLCCKLYMGGTQVRSHLHDDHGNIRQPLQMQKQTELM
jgi:hypothetical protein